MRAVAGLLGLLLVSPGLAQIVPPAPVSEAKKDDPIELSPFVITSTQDTGYWSRWRISVNFPSTLFPKEPS